METIDIFLIFVAGLAAGAINSVAGGGKFITFPALIFFGLSPVQANVTSSVALWPGAMAAAAGYRKEWMQQKEILPWLMAMSLVGSALGATVLLISPEKQFEALVPWLLLGATTLFAFGRPWIRKLHAIEGFGESHWGKQTIPYVLQFLIGFYGGYFGAGIGMLMLAVLQIMGLTHIHRMNALKMVLGSTVHAFAVLVFMFSSAVVWDAALVMLIGAVAGGYSGAAVAQRFPTEPVRWLVTLVGYGMTVYFFAM